ncbi:MAG TPA: SpoIIE family protein phosphatase [Steroidobacteraceae bacterium]|nr:SpoIIE family protein phosphatase [Steroidobacteraceae bacterium]
MAPPPVSAQQRFVMDDASNVGEARRAAQALASCEFNEEIAGKVAIVATELGNNCIRHAGGGELLLQLLGTGEGAMLELLAVDRGPGMHDVEICMRDGYSTGGTPGTGLGAMRRLAHQFDIYSRPGEGTVALARFGNVDAFRFGAICIAMDGEIDCGDAWHVERGAEGSAVLVVDGLGHGTFAAEAARAAVEVFADSPFMAPLEVMTRANAAMSRTRGGAAACALIRDGRVSYAGVGNISGALVAPGASQGLVSHNGTLGLGQRRTQQFEYTLAPGAVLVMHSDGLSARWDLKSRPDLLARHPAIVAAVIYRDHSRGRDDATIVVVPP